LQRAFQRQNHSADWLIGGVFEALGRLAIKQKKLRIVSDA
jgi:hypothetical protein